ncbi:hypothetical protein P167DRAFT_529856 [Morchella conica CCBAS932]|uniref:Zf-MIZ-domain-containing protein n=1 Tax=Morchella conica CCBAS932 TaxID=1392247 RepID=A0A3N4KAS6_9PEZI|nr:hypothetical protein P167DRAFT_529856 [Morchella conica CCBAS932]
MSSFSRNDNQHLIRHVSNSLIVRQLQAVLKAEGQPASGLKAMLQKRLVAYIESLMNANDTAGIDRVKQLIYRSDSPTPNRGAASPASFPSSNGYGSPPVVNMGSGHYPASATAAAAAVPQPYPPQISSNITRIHFKESPFYTVLKALSNIEQCPVMNTHRNTVTAIVNLPPADTQQLTDKSYRCMVYCAAVDGITPFTKDTEIAFPHQVELRVNNEQISGLNLRGLKNKPGSTRPADITDYILNKKALYRNEVTLTYALTQKKFAFVVNLVQQESVDQLVEKLRVGAFIAKETVIADMVKKNEDSDLVATASIMSLKCPLSTLRINLPVRSTFCNHIQCFDGTSFLQLQQQAPTWSCPTCNKSIGWKSLVVDQYFLNILNNTPKAVESVTIDVDGRWSIAATATNSPMPDSDDDNYGDEIIEILDSRVTKIKDEATPSSVSPIAQSSGEVSPLTRGGSGKRPFSQVIDLTQSDDDDEQLHPSKRTTPFIAPASINSGNGRLPGVPYYDSLPGLDSR